MRCKMEAALYVRIKTNNMYNTDLEFIERREI